MDHRYRNYLLDLGNILREKAIAAKSEKQLNDDSYNIGYLMAMHEVLSIMQSQADGFGIPLGEIGLDGINPEVDLL